MQKHVVRLLHREPLGQKNITQLITRLFFCYDVCIQKWSLKNNLIHGRAMKSILPTRVIETILPPVDYYK